MFGCVSKTPPLPVKKKLSYEFTKFYKIFYNFINCPVFIDIKQIYKQIKSERDFFLCIVALCLFPTTLFERFFFIWETKKVVAGRVRQVVVLCSNNYMGICLRGLSSRLTEVVV